MLKIPEHNLGNNVRKISILRWGDYENHHREAYKHNLREALPHIMNGLESYVSNL